jgi:hypothetical protein
MTKKNQEKLIMQLHELAPSVPPKPIGTNRSNLISELIQLAPEKPFIKVSNIELVKHLTIPSSPNQKKMEQKDPILRNESSNVNWNIVINTPCAVAYRFWTKLPGEDWQIIAEGGLADDIVDVGEFSAERGTQFAYWLGIGSDKPQSRFDISIVLTQDTLVLVNGIMQESGRVDDEGYAQRLETVSFK